MNFTREAEAHTITARLTLDGRVVNIRIAYEDGRVRNMQITNGTWVRNAWDALVQLVEAIDR